MLMETLQSAAKLTKKLQEIMNSVLEGKKRQVVVWEGWITYSLPYGRENLS